MGQWKHAHPRVAVLDFSRDRKMMSVLVSGGDGGAFTLFTKVRICSPQILMRITPLDVIICAHQPASTHLKPTSTAVPVMALSA